MLLLHVNAGRIPSAALDDWVEHVNSALNDGELSLQKDVCERSMKLCVLPLRLYCFGYCVSVFFGSDSLFLFRYRKTRPKASLESIRRSKLLNCDDVLEVFAEYGGPSGRNSMNREAAVAALRDFRAKDTIFEALGKT
jgi:hypothetical protein